VMRAASGERVPRPQHLRDRAQGVIHVGGIGHPQDQRRRAHQPLRSSAVPSATTRP
jgi:hypothetical protein